MGLELGCLFPFRKQTYSTLIKQQEALKQKNNVSQFEALPSFWRERRVGWFCLPRITENPQQRWMPHVSILAAHHLKRAEESWISWVQFCPSAKLTWQWKISMFNGKYIFKPSIFQLPMLVCRRAVGVAP